MSSTATNSDTQPTIDTLQIEIDKLRAEVEQLKANSPEDALSMVIMSGSLDRLLAAFIIATGGAAMFERVTIFVTFWGLAALRDPRKAPSKKDLMRKMLGKMLPNGAGQAKLSQMHMGGMGTGMIKGLMRKHNVMQLEQLMKQAADSGVQLYACQMSMDLMGIQLSEMIDYPGIKTAGVAKFLADAGNSKTTLFI